MYQCHTQAFYHTQLNTAQLSSFLYLNTTHLFFCSVNAHFYSICTHNCVFYVEFWLGWMRACISFIFFFGVSWNFYISNSNWFYSSIRVHSLLCMYCDGQVCCIRVGTRRLYCLVRWIFVFVGMFISLLFFFSFSLQSNRLRHRMKHSGQTSRIASNAFHFLSMQRTHNAVHSCCCWNFSVKVKRSKEKQQQQNKQQLVSVARQFNSIVYATG